MTLILRFKNFNYHVYTCTILQTLYRGNFRKGSDLMEVGLEKIKSLATMYLLLIIVGSSLFSIFIDYRALRKKKLKREAKLCRVLGYISLIGGVTFYIAMKYVS